MPEHYEKPLISTIAALYQKLAGHAKNHVHFAGLNNRQMQILAFLMIAPENADIYQKDLEAEFSMTAPSMTAQVHALEAKGMIRRETVSHDARLRKLVLTEKSRPLQHMLARKVKELDEYFFGNLSDQEIREFLRLSAKILGAASHPSHKI